MAKEWYLMNGKNDTLSGFESEDFECAATDTFESALQSALGTNVEICNCDLTVRKKQKVIIQGNLQDTKLNTLQRKMLAPIGTCKAGEYVYYKNRYWLIVGLVDDNKVYEKAILLLCNYLLTWKNSNGDIIQRWSNIASASQYNNGETSDKFLVLRSDQLMIITSNDEQSLLVEHGRRFIIDFRTKIYEKGFSKNTTEDTTKPLITYKITRLDSVLYDYQDSGHVQFMATQDEQHKADGYYVIDGNGYWLCDVPEQDTENIPTLSTCAIEYEEAIVYNGLEPAVFTAVARDGFGIEEHIEPRWKINCDFTDKLTIDYIENSISISVDDKKLINKSFELSLYIEGYTPISINVEIKSFI